jgi:hypothetical protein
VTLAVFPIRDLGDLAAGETRLRSAACLAVCLPTWIWLGV